LSAPPANERLAFLPAAAAADFQVRAVAEGGRERLACGAGCGFVHWDNPAPVVAALVEYHGRVVLARNQGWAAGAFGSDHRFPRTRRGSRRRRRA
jgi:hypothetical protein